MERTGRGLAWPSVKLVAVIAALGSVLGPLFDHIHLDLGVLGYPDADLFGQPWWVFPQFGFAAVVMVLPYRALLPFAPSDEQTRGSLRAVLVTCAVFVTLYFGTSLLHRFEWPLLAAYVVAFLLRLPREGRWWAFGHGIACAVGGTAWEASLCALGAFWYGVEQSLFGVPAWLPGLYLHAALFLRALARYTYAPPTPVLRAPAEPGSGFDRMIA